MLMKKMVNFSQKELEKLLNQKQSLVSIISANNETGVIQAVEEIGKLCKKYNSIFFTVIWHNQ